MLVEHLGAAHQRVRTDRFYPRWARFALPHFPCPFPCPKLCQLRPNDAVCCFRIAHKALKTHESES